MSRQFSPTIKRDILIERDAPRSVDAEVAGLFHIHETRMGFAVSPRNCGWKVGTFRNITIARKMARALSLLPSVNWDGTSPDEIFTQPEARTAAWDVVRSNRVD